MSWFVFVVFFVRPVIMPPTVTRSPSAAPARPVSSSTTKSGDACETVRRHTSSYSFRGCPLRYIPTTSFSKARSSSFGNSPTSGMSTPPDSALSPPGPLIISKSDIWPVMFFFWSFAFCAIRSSATVSFCFRVPGRQSIAPDLMKLSSVRRLISLLERR